MSSRFQRTQALVTRCHCLWTFDEAKHYAYQRMAVHIRIATKKKRGILCSANILSQAHPGDLTSSYKASHPRSCTTSQQCGRINQCLTYVLGGSKPQKYCPGRTFGWHLYCARCYKGKHKWSLSLVKLQPFRKAIDAKIYRIRWWRIQLEQRKREKLIGQTTLAFQVVIRIVFSHEPFPSSLHGDEIKSI